MKSKKQPAGKQVLDITRPKKRPAVPVAGASTTPKVIIQKRSIIPVTEAAETPAAEPIKPKQTARDLQPETATTPASPVEAAAPPAAKQDPIPEAVEEPAEPTPTENSQPEPEAGAKPSEDESKPEESQGEAKPADTDDPVPDPSESAESGEESDGTDEKAEADGKTNPHVRKALEDAKRQQEIQEYIDNKEFFVPINAIARKRSLRVSILLTILELLLGIVLLNLMLDAGLIQLLEKIPHTNFFNLR